MKQTISDYIIAIAVVLCSAVLLGALTFALAGYRFKKPTRTVQVDFPDVSGIQLHSELRYAGAPAGRVIAIRHLAAQDRIESGNPQNAVRITAEINGDIPPLPSDVTASLGSDTLLGEKFVALSAGDPASGVLADNAILRGQPGFSIEALTQSITPVMANANRLLENADKTVTTLRGELATILPNVTKVLTSTQSAADSADALLARATKLIADNEGAISSRLAELETVIKNLADLAKNANGFVGSTQRDVNARMDELGVVLQNLKVVTTHAKALTETLGRQPSKLIWGGKPNKLPSEAEILRSSKPVPAQVR